MTEATVTARLETNNPCEEVVVLTFTNAETYVSKKFGKVRAAQVTLMEDTTTLTYPVSLAVSGTTVTLTCDGVTDKKVCLTLYGDK
jgi:hypothetical protein